MFKRTMALLLVLAMAVAAAGCGGKPAQSPSAPATSVPATASATSTESVAPTPSGPIVIGLCAPITGTSHADGEKMRNAVMLAVDEANATGGLLGREVEVVVEDDQADLAGAVNACNKLISENVRAVIGPHRSTNVAAVDKLFVYAEIPFLAGGTSVMLDMIENEFFFRVRASEKLAAQAAGKYLAEVVKPNKVAILYNTDQYGTSGKNEIEQALTAAGITFISEGHTANHQDFTETLTKIKNEGCDAIGIWAHDAEIAILARQINELGIEGAVVCSPEITTKQVLDLCQPEWVQGWIGVTDYVDTNPDTAVKNFAQKYEAKYGTKTDIYASSYYGAAKILFAAIEAAGSDDPIAIRDALKATNGMAVPNGTAKANEKGEMIRQVVIAKIENKAPVYASVEVFD